MLRSLALGLIESHRIAAEPRRSAGRRGRTLLKIDHVVIEGDDSALALRAYEATGATRLAPELVLACAVHDPLRSAEHAEEQRVLERLGPRHGLIVSRWGNGAGHHVHCARFAAPGRIALGLHPTISACGAFGALGFEADVIEIAAVLAGTPHRRALEGVTALALTGRPVACVGGWDLALALERALGRSPSRGGILEVLPDGLAALSMADRLTMALRARALGLTAALFPSDEVTRRFLALQGREADWKALAGDPAARYDARLEIDLSTLEPLVGRAEGRDVVLARDVAGRPVRTVVIGPDASADDLRRFALRLAGRPIHREVSLLVTVGSRQIWDTLVDGGCAQSLAAAGARIAHGGDEARAWTRPLIGPAIGFGFAGTAREPRGVDVAGPEVCVASALAGALADPRSLEGGPGPDGAGDGPYVVNDAFLARPPTAEPRLDPGPVALAEVPLAPPVRGPQRGVVLIKIGDRVETDCILPFGPRVRSLRGSIPALARHAFAGVDPGFAARAEREGGGFVVAGNDFGMGPPRVHAVLVQVQLGVRAVLACSFDPRHRLQMIRLGVLPLRLESRVDYDATHGGDELEIPDLPDGLEVHRSLAVRNLTRGSQHVLRHDLTHDEIAIVLAGGLLRAATKRTRGA
ncbi:MAG: hypothetical protein E6K78_07175 [Candidatus Eisenbacteria bacterium]|uniref:Uncharacterized protein n=1 Tax=Eiseniibacteriota bacterium TaxID=2212470 RepID=A0A538TQ43_UNCEI|nr:MAG: hypothetical protein E6K78_07175 [Candidatus Eisenbacteria bacterium]